MQTLLNSRTGSLIVFIYASSTNHLRQYITHIWVYLILQLLLLIALDERQGGLAFEEGEGHGQIQTFAVTKRGEGLHELGKERTYEGLLIV